MRLHFPALVLLLFCTLLSSRCKKQNAEPQLPPETTTGAMTFGCKVNGKVFVPKGSIDGPGITSQYLYLGIGAGGGWFLNLTAANRIDEPKISMSIATDSLLVLQGNIYNLKRGKGNAYGQCLSGITFFQMAIIDTGTLVITRHDQVQRILSGRFSFTGSRSTGEQVKITEGRFDVRY